MIFSKMARNLSSWKRDWSLMEAFFTDEQVKDLETRIRHMKPQHVVFCSFENRFARSGGLAAVTKTILPALKKLEPLQRVLLLTPYYPYIMNGNKPKPTGLSFDVLYDNHTINVEICQHTETGDGGVEEYFLKADGFFNAENNINDPYSYCPEDPGCNENAIRRNALFFCKAAPMAVKTLGLEENIIFHLQEWQTALISLTAKEAMINETLTSCGCLLTLHNPFDSWIPWESLAHLLDNMRFFRHPASRNKDGYTANQLAIRLVDGPVTTVSEYFAEDLTQDRLQTGFYAPHLQDMFEKDGVYGVNNGLFIGFPPEYAEKEDSSTEEIKHIKTGQRKALLKILESYFPPERFGVLNYRNYKEKYISQLPDDIPILVMSGRLDPFQKGFDILLRAVEMFEKDEIKVVLSPLPVKNGDLDYFHEVCSKCRGNITVIPIRMEKGYRELQMGATYGIMPSIYEPFGAAIEYMVSGTVTIARATGGLNDQIHHMQCGLLFREDSHTYTVENIREYSDASDMVQLRKRNPWAQAMAEELYKTIKIGINIYRHQPDKYYRMIQNGFKRARSFTWERAAKKYYEIYSMSGN